MVNILHIYNTIITFLIIYIKIKVFMLRYRIKEYINLQYYIRPAVLYMKNIIHNMLWINDFLYICTNIWNNYNLINMELLFNLNYYFKKVYCNFYISTEDQKGIGWM